MHCREVREKKTKVGCSEYNSMKIEIVLFIPNFFCFSSFINFLDHVDTKSAETLKKISFYVD